MIHYDVLKLFADALGVVTELGFFNQWIFLEPRDRTHGNTASFLVVLYAICQPISWYVVSTFGQGLTAVQISALFCIYLPATAFPVLCLMEWHDENKTKPKEQPPPANSNLKWDLLVLGLPTVAAAFHNTALLLLVSLVNRPDNQDSAVVIIYAFCLFLATRNADYCICRWSGRPLMIGLSETSQVRSATGRVVLMLASRTALSWLLGLGASGPLEQVLGRMLP